METGLTFHCKVTKANKRKIKPLFLLPTHTHTIKLKVEPTSACRLEMPKALPCLALRLAE